MLYTAQDFWDKMLANPEFAGEVPIGPYRDLHRDVVFAVHAHVAPLLSGIATPSSIMHLAKETVRFTLDAGWIDRMSEAEAALDNLTDPAAVAAHVATQRQSFEDDHAEMADLCRLMALAHDPREPQSVRDEVKREMLHFTDDIVKHMGWVEEAKFRMGMTTLEAIAYARVDSF